jgi:flagellar motor switch protein FliG
MERLLRDVRRLAREQPKLLAWVVGQWSHRSPSAEPEPKCELPTDRSKFNLSGADAIAVLIATLGKSAATVAFQNLERDCLIEVGLSIYRQAVIPRTRQREVLVACLEEAKHAVVLLDDPQAFLQAALEGAVGERTANDVHLALAVRRSTTVAELLSALSLDVIGKIVRREPPQVAAAVLGQIEAPRVSALYALLDEPLARDLAARQERFRELTPSALRQLHEGLVGAFNAVNEASVQAEGGDNAPDRRHSDF